MKAYKYFQKTYFIAFHSTKNFALFPSLENGVYQTQKSLSTDSILIKILESSQTFLMEMSYKTKDAYSANLNCCLFQSQ